MQGEKKRNSFGSTTTMEGGVSRWYKYNKNTQVTVRWGGGGNMYEQCTICNCGNKQKSCRLWSQHCKPLHNLYRGAGESRQ